MASSRSFLPTARFMECPSARPWAAASFTTRRSTAELGLTPPKTWAEFMANNEKVKAAGKVAVAQTYRDTWTSQLFVLADYYQSAGAGPEFRRRLHGQQGEIRDDARGRQRLRDVYRTCTTAACLTRILVLAPMTTACAWLQPVKPPTIRCCLLPSVPLKQNYPDETGGCRFLCPAGR